MKTLSYYSHTKNTPLMVTCLLTFIIIFFGRPGLGHSSDNEIQSSARCAVCGMFVAKYPVWITEIIFEDGNKVYFDGTKDMLVFFFNPNKYSTRTDIKGMSLEVKDYYSVAKIDAKKAFFVVGSDVYGPMGHEFIPFSSREAAEAFKKDHHGKEILTFNQITSERVESMRSGSRMK